MNNPCFAMDTYFYHRDGRYPPRARAQMAKELGYAGVTLTIWDERGWADVPVLLQELDRLGLSLGSVYMTLDVAKEGNLDPRLDILLGQLAGRPTLLELALRSSDSYDKPSSSRADGRAAESIRQVCSRAGTHGVRVALYPHANFWMERIEDAVRLAMRVNRPDLGVVFNLFHWLYSDGAELEQRLLLCQAKLWDVTINGCRFRGPRDVGIETLDSGNIDLFPVLGTLTRLGYSGPISVQGYGIGGDVYANLRRSITAWKDLTQRLVRHGDWVQQDPPH